MPLHLHSPAAKGVSVIVGFASARLTVDKAREHAMKARSILYSMLACVASLAVSGRAGAHTYEFSPANTRFVLNGALSFDADRCLAQWIVRTRGGAQGRAQVTIANQYYAGHCLTGLSDGLPWKLTPTGPNTLIIHGVTLGVCQPQDVKARLVGGVLKFDSYVGDSCLIKGSLMSTPALSIVPR
jgi:hypothetical protein